MDLGLSGKRALVLGASRGLGKAIARTLAEEGVEVIAAARRKTVIDDWRTELGEPHSSRITARELDLADIGMIDREIDQIIAEGGVDILINNSGGPPPKTVLDSSRDEWIEQFEKMAASLMHITQKLMPAMMDKGWGRVITIASSGVEQPIPSLAQSNGIRSALIGWSKTLSMEVASKGVTVNVVLPGRIHTERVDELDAAASERTGKSREEISAQSAATIPAGRIGRPQEFADVTVFLASERASYVTGSKIRIDGGAIRSI